MNKNLKRTFFSQPFLDNGTLQNFKSFTTVFPNESIYLIKLINAVIDETKIYH